MAREKLRKYPAICELEAKHGVDLGTNYRTQTARSSFVHYSAEAIREELPEKLRKAKFFSLLLDGSTDAANVDNELVLVVWFDKDGTNEKVSTRTSHFKIMRPSTVTALKGCLICCRNCFRVWEFKRSIGTYTNHLAAMSEDRSFKSTDRAKILGYYRQWTNAKFILGCAICVDLLTPCVSLSKVMQQDNLDILAALTGLVKSVKELEKLESLPLQQWATYVSTVRKCSKEGENTIYQAQQLKNFDAAETHFENHHVEYCTLIKNNIKSRLAWSDLQCLRDIIFILATQGWQKALDENDPLEAVDRLVQ